MVNELVGKCDDDIDGNEMVFNGTLFDNEKVYRSCRPYVMLLIITFLSMIISWASMGFFSANFATRMKLSEINIYPIGNSKMPRGK